jgi:uncharacterized membrane protein YciS (DUF1049 family)
MSDLVMVAILFGLAWVVFAGVLWRVNAQDATLEEQAKRLEDKSKV